MKQKLLYTILAVFFTASSFAQQIFITKGKIEYERKTNQHAFMEENSVWDEMAKKNMPKFITFYFDLIFKDGKTIYKTGREPETRQPKFWGVFAADNTIATNLDSGTSVTQKSVYGDMFLISDSVRKIDWKIQSEIREIAGFECRKAVGKIMDSIVVIAFYTDEIIPSGGPESFNGLPGMILGIAIPRMHTTWYATKLELEEVREKDLEAPKRGKKYTGANFRVEVKNILKNWGDEAVRMQSQILL